MMKLISRYLSLVILIIGVISSSAAVQGSLSNQKNSGHDIPLLMKDTGTDSHISSGKGNPFSIENQQVLNVAIQEDRFPVAQTTRNKRDDALLFALDEIIMKNRLINVSKPGLSRELSHDFNYVVYNNDIPCILCNVTVSLSVPYRTTDGKTASASLKSPTDAGFRGYCGPEKANLTVVWLTSESTVAGFYIGFVRDDSSFSLDQIAIIVDTDATSFPGAVDKNITGVSHRNLGLFSAPLKDGIHKCSVNTEGKADTISYVFSDVSLIAFNDVKNITDKKETNCKNGSGISGWWIVGGIFGMCLLVVVIGVVVYNVRSR